MSEMPLCCYAMRKEKDLKDEDVAEALEARDDDIKLEGELYGKIDGKNKECG